MRPRPVLLLVVLAVLAVLVPATPSRAADAVTGDVAVDATVDLAGGSWDGIARGSLGGTHGDHPWSLVLQAPTDATFDHQGDCTAGQAEGELRIDAVVDAEVAEVFGLYQDDGPLPLSINRLGITADFDWQWAGGAGALTLSNVVVVIDVYGLGPVTLADGSETVSTGAATAVVDCADGSLTLALTALSVS